jgi:TonB-linked SusC/RagA family outer membrane protein
MRKNALPAAKMLLLLWMYCLSSGNLLAADTTQVKKTGAAGSYFPGDSLTKKVQLIYSALPASLTAASTSAVYNHDLIKAPVTSVKNALIGRMAGLVTYQGTGLPGSDAVNALLRGQAPLIIIDGVPRNLTIFDLEEIESVTAVKDALGTAVLGARGSGGALVITTRKGIADKQTVSFTVQTAFQQPLKMVKPLRSYDYARLKNEALTNDGQPIAYSDADLAAYRNGSDPYGHPDVDWAATVLKKNSLFNRYSLNFRGGNQTARYFVSLEHVKQGGFLQTSDVNKYNTNNDFKSYVIRSNIEVNLDSKVSMGLSLLGRILNGNQPGYGTNPIIGLQLITPSNAYPVFNPNGSLGGNQVYQYNLYGVTMGSGYQQNYKRDVFADFYLKRTLDEITKGLWIRGLISFNATLSQNTYRSKSFATYQMKITGTDTSYTKFNADGSQGNSTSVEYQGRQGYAEVSLGYNRNFGAHGIDASLVASQDNSVSGSDLSLAYRGVAGRASYNFQHKYIAEISFGYNGSNRYPEGTRYRLYPAAGLAWNIKEEAFLKKVSWLNSLKLFTSYGKTGWDKAGYFVYNQYYYDGAGATFGATPTGNTSINELVLANTSIDYEKANKLNAGFEASLIGDHLQVRAEYYSMKFYDLLMQRGKNSAVIGNDYPDENIGSNRYKGLDFDLKWQVNTSKIGYFVNANMSILQSKVLFQDEVYRPYEWMKRTGRPTNQLFGYTAVGLFQTTDEISKSATIDGYTPQRGDIKYKDLNGDGVINQFDQGAIGNSSPLISYGLSAGFTYKGFDCSALLQGVKNQNITLTGNSEWEFQNNGYGQAYEQHLDRWTPTNTAASYPRLTAGTNVNNHQVSSYWVHSGDYTRLKFVELGYTLPKALIKKVKMEKIRVFVSATNLFTIAAYDRVDPEVNNGAYPIQRVINTGVNIQF